MGRAIRLLCTGDIHVGRRPSRVGDFIDAKNSSCAAMFTAIVALATREKVDALLISGDLVDKENKFHEAYGPVERGLKKLAAEGIDVFAVSGNHDFDVLPRLADAVGTERFHLLGRGGSWERKPLVREGSPILNIVGWSFPAEHVPDNPMRSFGSLAPAENGSSPLPALGLLHGDLDQPDSRYAPVSLRELQATSMSAWLLGHVHKPRWIAPSNNAGVLYPGSPQAMDPGETGAHGPWMVEIETGGRIAARQLNLSRVRYDLLDIDLSEIQSIEALNAHVPKFLGQRLGESCQECGPLELCSVRLRFTGATPLHGHLKDVCREIREQLHLPVNGFTVRVEQIILDTRPPIDLAELSTGSSVAADLARLVLELSAADPAAPAGDGNMTALLARGTEVAELICGGGAYRPLSPADHPPPSRAAARSAMIRQGMLLLQTLREQKLGAALTGELS